MAAPVFLADESPTADQVNDWMVNVTFARKTGTQSIPSSTALQNDSQLVVPVKANAIYQMDALLLYDGDAAGDLQMGWSAPSGATLDYSAMGLHVLAGGYNDDQTACFNLSASAPSLGAIGAGTTCAGRLFGLLVMGGTGGNLQFRWAQRTAHATPTRVFANSFLSLRRLS